MGQLCSLYADPVSNDRPHSTLQTKIIQNLPFAQPEASIYGLAFFHKKHSMFLKLFT